MTKLIILVKICYNIMSFKELQIFDKVTSWPQLISLSTIVLNSRDWSEIVWLLEILHFKINLAISFIRKNPLECIG